MIIIYAKWTQGNSLISIKKVDTDRFRLLKKMSLRNNAELSRFDIQKRLIEMESLKIHIRHRDTSWKFSHFQGKIRGFLIEFHYILDILILCIQNPFLQSASISEIDHEQEGPENADTHPQKDRSLSFWVLIFRNYGEPHILWFAYNQKITDTFRPVQLSNNMNLYYICFGHPQSTIGTVNFTSFGRLWL